jgi:peptidoglycan/xylan/chitin deacetylase (PgdA/CDA1 family)
VSFTFDDFPRTAYAVGGAVLKRAGVRGTFYTALGLMHSSNGSGDQFCLDDLYSLVADGHELASHTLHHVSSRTTALGSFLEEVREGRAAIRRIPGIAVSNNFAYPFGAVTAAAKGAVGNEMLSCRGSFEGVNGPRADLNLLRANPLNGGADQVDHVRRLLDDNERLKGWLIFYTHDVDPTPSSYGCTPRLLESAVNLALERSMRILTVDAVLAAAGQNQPRPLTG